MSVDYSHLPAGTVAGADTGADGTSVTIGQPTPTGPRHLVLPLRLVNGPNGTRVFATYEQDTIEEVTQSVKVLLTTEVGERYRDAPDYGVESLLTGGPVQLAMAEAAVAEFEPRARTTFTAGDVDAAGQQKITVNISLVEGDDQP